MKTLLIFIALFFCTIPLFAQSSKTNFQLLQGKWKLTTAKNNFIVVKNKMFTTLQIGYVDTQQFQIGDTDPNIDGEEPNDNGSFITFGDTTWYIEKLTATILQVTTIIGDTLTYKKVK